MLLLPVLLQRAVATTLRLCSFVCDIFSTAADSAAGLRAWLLVPVLRWPLLASHFAY